ncbi:hypothetical protein HMPREF0972_00404 [Actinomyces sp. oral taxon 848 str. F0332]|nr:hypothetical protein HMPREF0972_00404 [Actinomyces sp. oral taxon 848 str. F0332]
MTKRQELSKSALARGRRFFTVGIDACQQIFANPRSAFDEGFENSDTLGPNMSDHWH